MISMKPGRAPTSVKYCNCHEKTNCIKCVMPSSKPIKKTSVWSRIPIYSEQVIVV